MPGLRWAYGVTTVPSRRRTLLPRTLLSLAAGGFTDPWVFCDGPWEVGQERVAGVTQRSQPLLVFGNWVLGLYELYIRNPVAERYAVFQDDIVVCKNLRAYLDTVKYPDKGYLNLYTYPGNESLATKGVTGFYPSDQRGKGALALAFSRRAVLQLLVADHLVMKPIPADLQQQTEYAQGLLYRGQCAVDGGIVTSYVQAGWKEYVHNPSLVQHVGEVSSFRPRTYSLADGGPSKTFRGEDFDPLTLVS